MWLMVFLYGGSDTYYALGLATFGDVPGMVGWWYTCYGLHHNLDPHMSTTGRNGLDCVPLSKEKDGTGPVEMLSSWSAILHHHYQLSKKIQMSNF